MNFLLVNLSWMVNLWQFITINRLNKFFLPAFEDFQRNAFFVYPISIWLMTDLPPQFEAPKKRLVERNPKSFLDIKLASTGMRFFLPPRCETLFHHRVTSNYQPAAAAAQSSVISFFRGGRREDQLLLNFKITFKGLSFRSRVCPRPEFFLAWLAGEAER